MGIFSYIVEDGDMYNTKSGIAHDFIASGDKVDEILSAIKAERLDSASDVYVYVSCHDIELYVKHEGEFYQVVKNKFNDTDVEVKDLMHISGNDYIKII